MHSLPRGRVERFETWLTKPRFIILLTILILLNLFVYLWWFNRPDFEVGSRAVGTAMLQGLQVEKQQLQELLDSSCGSEGMGAYERGERGPLNRSQKETTEGVPSSKISSPADLVSLLDAATVRVLVAGGAGTGFFIDKNTVITNRHVVEDVPSNKIFITSKALGQHPIAVRLLAMSKNSDFGNPDFAILRVENTPSAIKALAIAVDPAVLQGVVAVGYPGQDTAGDANQVTPSAVFTEGQISVLQPQKNGTVLVVHTANMARGSSGGPLVSRCGHIVGVNTFIRSDKQNVDGRSLYALSATALRNFLTQAGVEYREASADCSSTTVSKAE
jgi:serine protease Do